ncbi:Threonine/homoserine efflux transporter RhtA [Prauserella aidingensis]|uniref:DMT family transporter n=1 Tax=Prauserella aidingensis TaxID=387890 RepID=UPI0020A28F4E|nr:DMT family transporter [Prauserella aidingensis]MCP2254766.1 Threonine/homoserine efflux transporter RhtA [Prauserella aidingensis]
MQVESRKSAVLPWVAALAVMVLWASSFVVIRGVGVHFSAGAMALLRLIVASAALGLGALLYRPRWPGTPAAWGWILLWGVSWFGVYTVVLNLAEQHIDAGTAAMLVNLAPLLVALASGVLLGEGLPARLFVGIGVSMAGIVVITLATTTGTLTAAGVVLSLIAALLYAGSVLLQKWRLTGGDSYAVTLVGIAGAMVACTPFSGELADDLSAASPASVLAVVYLGLFPTALAFNFWGYALKHVPAGVLSSSSLVVPALVVLLSWIALAEVPPLLAILGGALCLTGAGFSIVPHIRAALRRPEPVGEPARTPTG